VNSGGPVYQAPDCEGKKHFHIKVNEDRDPKGAPRAKVLGCIVLKNGV